MFKFFLKKFRSLHILNKIFRHTFKKFLKINSAVHYLITRWPVNGIETVKCESTAIKMICTEDDAIVNQAFYYGFGRSTSTELSTFLKFAKKSNCIGDIGANTGLYGLFSEKENPDAVIYAFEPYPTNYIRLNENIRINKSNIIPQQIALSMQEGEASFFAPKDEEITTISSLELSQVEIFNNDIRKIHVKCDSLDNWCLKHQVSFDLIKIDVELHEYQVLQGSKEVLKSKPVIFMENHNFHIKNDSSENTLKENFNLKIENFLNQYNYSFYAMLGNGIYRIDSLQNCPQVLNVILLPFKSSKIFYNSKSIDQLITEFELNKKNGTRTKS